MASKLEDLRDLIQDVKYVRGYFKGVPKTVKKKYRKRCQDCKKMFNTDKSYQTRCPECQHKYIMMMSKFGKDLIEDQISVAMGGGALSPEVMSIIQELSLKSQAPVLVGPDGKKLQGTIATGDIPLIAIQSSNVKGGGTFNNELIVQFHQTAKQGGQRTYRYKLATPEQAQEVFLELANAGSAGKWVWENIRGTQKGPAYFPPHKPTMGGTSASLIPYTVGGRSPVKTRLGYKGYDELSKELRKYKMSVKDPATSAEPFTIPEIHQFQRKETLKELRELISQVMVKKP